MIDINTGSGELELTPALTQNIWAEATKRSAVMSASRRVNLTNGAGITWPIITSKPEASWVGETGKRPVGEADFTMKTMRTYGMSVLLPFSNEFRRDWNGLFSEVQRLLPEALGLKFDGTVLGQFAAPGSDFDTLANSPVVQIGEGETALDGLLQARRTIANAGGRLTHWLADPDLESVMLASAVAKGWSNPFDARTGIGHVLGAPVAPLNDGTMPAGFFGAAGNFRDGSVYGTVGNIRLSLSREASLEMADGTQLNLWQHGMFAIKAEAEFGFVVRDPRQFVRLASGPVSHVAGFTAPIPGDVEAEVAGPFQTPAKTKASK